MASTADIGGALDAAISQKRQAEAAASSGQHDKAHQLYIKAAETLMKTLQGMGKEHRAYEQIRGTCRQCMDKAEQEKKTIEEALAARQADSTPSLPSAPAPVTYVSGLGPPPTAAAVTDSFTHTIKKVMVKGKATFGITISEEFQITEVKSKDIESQLLNCFVLAVDGVCYTNRADLLAHFRESKKGTKVEMELSHHPPPHALEAISTKVHQGGPVEFRFDGGSVSAAVKAAVTVPSFSLPRLAQRDWGSSSDNGAGVFTWYWNSGGGGSPIRWTSYSSSVGTVLERALQNPRETRPVEIGGGRVVDLGPVRRGGGDGSQFAKATPDRRRAVRRVLWHARKPDHEALAGHSWVPCETAASMQLESLAITQQQQEEEEVGFHQQQLLQVYRGFDPGQVGAVARGPVECKVHDGDVRGLLQLIADGEGGSLTAAATEAYITGQNAGNLFWDGQAWSEVFAAATAQRNYRGAKALRILVIRSTLAAIDALLQQLTPAAETTPATMVAVPPELQDRADVLAQQLLLAATKTVRCTEKTFPKIPRADGVAGSRMVVEVRLGDCVVEALRLKDLYGYNVAVLNMANATKPGGGYLHGAGAQEENLCRRTGYSMALDAPSGFLLQATAAAGLPTPAQGGRSSIDSMYPIGECDGLYTPDMPVLRGPEDASSGYSWFQQRASATTAAGGGGGAPCCVSFIAVAAIDRPPLMHSRETGELLLEASARSLTAAKMRMMLRMGHHYGHDAIVLSAFGCGAFGNPPADIARLFHEVLAEPEFACDGVGCFKHVSFAIIDDQNAGREHNPLGNYRPFVDVFGSGQTGPPVKARAEGYYVAVEDLPTWSSLGPQVIHEMMGDHGESMPDAQGFMPQQRLNDRIKLWRGDITRLNADAIVNAANWKLVAGGGICGAIFAAAGKRELEAECAQHINGCAEGQTVVTSGCKLPARFILHTVGPQGPKPDILQSCYNSCLDTTLEYGLSSVAFCMISCGVFGYPVEDATRTALLAVRGWLESDSSRALPTVVFCVFTEADEALYRRLLPTVFPLPW